MSRVRNVLEIKMRVEVGANNFALQVVLNTRPRCVNRNRARNHKNEELLIYEHVMEKRKRELCQVRPFDKPLASEEGNVKVEIARGQWKHHEFS